MEIRVERCTLSTSFTLFTIEIKVSWARNTSLPVEERSFDWAHFHIRVLSSLVSVVIKYFCHITIICDPKIVGKVTQILFPCNNIGSNNRDSLNCGYDLSSNTFVFLFVIDCAIRTF